MLNLGNIRQKKWGIILKVSLNLSILIIIILVLLKKKNELYLPFNIYFLFIILYEFFILFLISLRILSLSHALNQKISLKDIYLITITTKFYNIFFPSLLTEAIRGIKYNLAGISDRYNILFLVIFDRIVGFITFFIIFLLSAFSLKIFRIDKTTLLLSLALLLFFIIVLFNITKIRYIFNHKPFNKHLSKKALFSTLVISLMAQMAIMFKYFYIFQMIIHINLDLIHTIYICSASHLSQIIPFSAGLFSIKDGFLFFIITTGQGEYIKALNLILILGSIEILTGIAGGLLESIGLMKKTLSRHR